MANHAHIHRENPITYDELKDTLEKINQDLFNGLLTFEFDDKEKHVMALLTKDRYDCVEMWISNDLYDEDDEETRRKSAYIEIRHGHGGNFYWWLDNTLTDQLSQQLDATLWDEGTGNVENGFTQTHPTAATYIMISTYRDEELDYLKEQLPNEVFEEIVMKGIE